ncbi:unnamed protein product [Linum trigynum]|uniref:Uncharacterized protein n=1 Tax=Linum trigynum TaxID=586398 RepID=A0AAV2CV49_9ROSI
MRGALSSLLEWPCWLGGWLLEILSSLFLLSLKNQKGDRCRHAGDFLFDETGHGSETNRDTRWMNSRKPMFNRCPHREGCCPKRVLCKRKRALLREDLNPSSETYLSKTSPAKKCRIVRLHEWRFWLPSTSDLVGDQSLLSKTDEFINVVSSPMGRAGV